MRLPRNLTAFVFAALSFFFVQHPSRATGSAALVYRGGEQGRVIFNGRGHASKGFRCADCHTNYARTGRQLFTTHKSGRIGREDHSTNTKCFACHNGKVAFDGCPQCHTR
jgi:phosphate transport system substrate-binding protein